MLIACITVTPSLMDWMTQRFSSQNTGDDTFSRPEIIQKLQALYKSKPLSEMTMDDLYSLINSPETEQFSDTRKTELRRMLIEELKLSPEEIKALGSFYQDYIGTPDTAEPADATSTDAPDTGIRKSGGLRPTNGL
jgi:hypothetical protein